MRFCTILLMVACAGLVCAQTPDDPEVAKANAEIERLRGLVAAGAAPRLQLEKAQATMEDAQDEAILRKTIYGSELTEAQSEDMLAAAVRRLDRRRKAYEAARKLVDLKAAPPLSLKPLQDDVDAALRELDLAESRSRLTYELAQMALAEEALFTQLAEAPAGAPAIAERYDGDGIFNMVALSRIEAAFEAHFGKPMPISAMGETAVHRALGFDHRGRVDVGLHPDTPEGQWLRAYLMENRIPFFLFRQAVPGKATGAHIHIGPISPRISSGG
jgi:hypothetical protein